MSSTTTNTQPLNTFYYKCKCGYTNRRQGYNKVFFNWCASCGKELNYEVTVKDEFIKTKQTIIVTC